MGEKNKYLRHGSRSNDAKLPKSLTPKQKLFNDKDLEEFKKLGWTGPPSLKTLNKDKRKKRKK